MNDLFTFNQWTGRLKLQKFAPLWRLLSSAPVLAVMLLVLLTAVLGVRFYNEPQLSVGMQVDRDIIAPYSIEVVDSEETQKAQAEARREAVQVFASQPEASARVRSRLEDLLIEGNQLLQTAGPLPYLNTGILPTQAQLVLRAMPNSSWLQIKQLLARKPVPMRLATLSTSERSILQALSKQPEAGDQLIIQVEAARAAYLQAAARGHTAPFMYQDRLLRLSPSQWKQVSSQARQVSRSLLAMGIIPGLPQQFRTQGILAQIPPDFSTDQKQLVVDLVLSVIEPNLQVDRLETLRQAEQTAMEIQPIRIKIKRGQVLLQQGELVTARWFGILDQLELTRRGVNWPELGLLGLIEAAALGLFIWWRLRLGKPCVQKQVLPRTGRPCLRKQDLLLMGVVVLSTAGIGALLGVELSAFLPLIAAGLLLGNFYGSAYGIAVLLALAGPLWFALKLPFTAFVPVLVGGLVAAWMVGRLRSREEMALLGVLAALVQGLVYIVLTLLFADYSWPDLLVNTLQMAGGGLVCSILALGASPYLESLFDVVTAVRLSELANPNRPLLKRMATEAPGSFQHTLFVANLAEAAARELGDNADLVRVGTLYHDIGKMVRPLYFIENQMGLPNPHDHLDDPWRSADIIRAHVSDGLKLARKYGLPKVIQDFIPEHQGTIRVACFYHQACKQVGSENVREEDFRYAGPAPRSRETGILMLADACEAALRSLSDTTEQEAVAMVQRILRARWQEDQLKDSGLFEEELPLISRTFVKVWKEQNHQRIRYPVAGRSKPQSEPAPILRVG